MKKTVAVLTATVAVGAGSMFWAVPATADLTTRCVGEAGAVTVPGDLIVPRDTSCTLDGTTVLGDVRVAQGADLVAENAVIEGQLSGAVNAYIEMVGGTVGGQVVLSGAYGAYLESTEAADRVLTRPGGGSEVGGFIYTSGAGIAGDVISRSGELFIEGSDVAGSIDSRGSAYTDVHETFIDGSLVVRGNQLGSVVCGSVVAGEALFADNTDTVQIGADGPVTDCATGSYWGSNITVAGNTGGVVVDNNIVNGAVTLRGNTPITQLGQGNMIRGEVTGEFQDWTDAGVSMRSMSEPRDAAIERKIEERRTVAVDSAAETGPADLGL